MLEIIICGRDSASEREVIKRQRAILKNLSLAVRNLVDDEFFNIIILPAETTSGKTHILVEEIKATN